MIITIYDVFELNRVLHKLISQQKSFKIQTAFKIYNLIKWLDETEKFIFDRISLISDSSTIDIDNPIHKAMLSSQIPFVDTTLTFNELMDTIGDVNIEINDITILEKMLGKTES